MILLLGCANPANVGDEVPQLRTGDTLYTVTAESLAWYAEIDYTFENPESGDTIRLWQCRGTPQPDLEKFVDGEWVLAWSRGALLCDSHVLLEPGATHRDTVHFTAYYPDNDIHPKLEVPEVEGVYRLNWSAPQALPVEQRSSNRFRIVTEGALP